jgi:hypothetical protein
MHEAIKSTAGDTMTRPNAFRSAVFALLVCSVCVASRATAQPLEGTKPLEEPGDLAAKMVDGIHRFVDRETAGSVEKRAAYWHRDTSSPQKYTASVEPNRKHLAKILGVVDERVKDTSPQFIAGPGKQSLVARGPGFEVHVVRWEALLGVYGEGLLFEPDDPDQRKGDVVFLPDADLTPEFVSGFGNDGVSPVRTWAYNRRVLVMTLVDRSDTYSVAANGARPTNQPHREFVYRPAFEVGRHVIGYELQKVFAAVDWFASDPKRKERRISVVGTGEGGMLALYAGALDTRIDFVEVGGYFGPREELWREPIYRNVFGLLREFGDAEIASLIAPRELAILLEGAPKVDGPPAPHDGRSGAAPGRIATPAHQDVELARLMTEVPAGWGRPGLYGAAPITPERMAEARRTTPPLEPLAPLPDAAARQKRQVDEMQAFTQTLVRRSEAVRRALWAKADRSSPAKWRRRPSRCGRSSTTTSSASSTGRCSTRTRARGRSSTSRSTSATR